MSRLPVFHQEILDEMKGWIHERPTVSLTISHLSERSGFSKWHLQRLFKRHTGTTLGHYIKGVRLERAAWELMMGEKAVIDIALECGYDAQQSYTRATTHYFGRPPGAIRQMTAAEKNALYEQFTFYSREFISTPGD